MHPFASAVRLFSSVDYQVISPRDDGELLQYISRNRSSRRTTLDPLIIAVDDEQTAGNQYGRRRKYTIEADGCRREVEMRP